MTGCPTGKRRMGAICPLLFLLIIFLWVVGPAIAGAPPAENRPGYLLPNLVPPYINTPYGDCFSADELSRAGSRSVRQPPFFPGMSPYAAFMNISCNRTGDRYVTESWYFTDWDEFRQQREDLFRYLARHGTVSNVTLDLSEELARTNNTYVAGLKTHSVDAVRYESRETSGYFLIFSTDFFPGSNYYIVYYGVVGPAGLQQHSHNLETLIMTVFPGMMEYQTFESNPASPMEAPPVPIPAGISVVAAAAAIAARAFRKRDVPFS
ncbi:MULTISPECIES: hypothetical protein [unclassified Methanoregula]|uniref:hypothetical protein n=1 Tax=unclassified Methanoregula TaxID=2649730 RepID=UPI0009C56DC8|nr:MULTISPECIES: hypothetical protein [unclassified Methanoregula]OPX62880.1 MAG: hypothetical protein A4E33_02009 [Methanoregula sp. PtaB.Bin085]OPY35317.1 MAG: hypothetical protein A4E34_00845 [Methanoregula sp. PtaU1.Bin006]